MKPKSIKVISNAEPAVGTSIGVHSYWPGGRGWFVASGTFIGSTANIGVVIITSDSAAYDAISVPVPDLTGGISAEGIYPFAAPEGILSISSPGIAEEDTLIITSLTLVEIEPVV